MGHSFFFQVKKRVDHSGVYSQDPREVLQAALELIVAQVDPRQAWHCLLSAGRSCLPFLDAGEESKLQTLKSWEEKS